MERTQEASGEGPAEADHPKEPLENQAPGLELPLVPAEKPQRENPESSSRAGLEATGASLDHSEKMPPPSRRGPPLSLGYGAFRRLGSSSREPPSPGSVSAEEPRDGESAGTELVPWAASGEPTSGTWAPMELQVDVRVKPVGAAGGSRAPSPAPSTRFLTVPVPESPAFPRHASAAHPLLQRTPSSGSTWGRGSPLAGARAERGCHAEGWDGHQATCRCRCQEAGLPKEDAAGMDGKKLPRAIALIGLPTYMKSLRWALVVMAALLAVSTVAIVALASRTGAKCRPCPRGWMWSEEQCYYLSKEQQDWEGSRAFCSAHHATLPLLSHIQDFLNRYSVANRSWLGVQRGPEGWHWIDGVPLQSQQLPEDGKDQPDLNCGGLEEGRLVALDCSLPRPWVCARESK
uniref:killer cell lectin-like receptor subfamily G member 2 n=1 Tax=Jaculus jaculus TaxID=51337 RepID=UPI001E1B50C7|nr:killer cell lectin-like receptor subfamily G member 2 [Jaculus jaculus]